MDLLSIFTALVNRCIAASWLVIAILLLRLIFKKAPRWIFCLLWGLTALRLVCPWIFESRLSLIPSAEVIPKEMLYYEGSALWEPAKITIISNPAFTQTVELDLGRTVDAVQIKTMYLSIAWIAGVVLMLLYALISCILVMRRIRTSTVFRDNIRQSEQIDSPFLFGLFKPTVYIPYSIDGDDLEYVIAHENAHIKRKDHWWKPVGFLILSVYWFNPLFWAAYIFLCRDIESACDEKVIKEMEKDCRREYSTALLNCSVYRRRIAACPLAFGEVSVKKRIKSVMNYKKPAFWVVVLAVLASVAAVVCLITNPVGSKVRNPWVREYEPGQGNIMGNVNKKAFEDVSEDFAIGADRYGRAVFKDPDKAFAAMKELYGDGLDLIKREFSLMPIGRNNYSAYKIYGWQATTGTAEEQEQAAFVSKFLDIYENSFEKSVPNKVNAEPTAEAKDNETAGQTQDSAMVGEMIPGTVYVSWQCLYMNPLSSFAAVGGDSGQKYIIGDGFFASVNRSDGVVQSVYGEPLQNTDENAGYAYKTDVSEWKWKEFPYTDDEWNAMFVPSWSGHENINRMYGEVLYQPLQGIGFLLNVNGSLLLVETRTNDRMGTYIWSIYSLVPESSMGSARWEFIPARSASYPAFRFEFDMDYTKINASCTDSILVNFDSPGQQTGNDMTFYFDKAMYWSPYDGDGNIVSNAEIHFFVSNGDKTVYPGTIYVTAEPSSNGKFVYSASLAGTGLHMEQNIDKEGAVISYVY